MFSPRRVIIADQCLSSIFPTNIQRGSSVENKRKHDIDFEQAQRLRADAGLVEIPARTIPSRNSHPPPNMYRPSYGFDLKGLKPQASGPLETVSIGRQPDLADSRQIHMLFSAPKVILILHGEPAFRGSSQRL